MKEPAEIEDEECADMQQEEWLVLESIYGSALARTDNSAKLRISIKLPANCYLNKEEIEYLPDAVLQFRFSKRYPVVDPPIFRVSFDIPFLSQMQLKNLKQALLALWVDMKGPVIYQFAEYLEFDFYKSIFEESDGQRFILKLGAEKEQQFFDNMIRLNYNKIKEALVVDCKICFTRKIGIDCHRFRICRHEYCRKCLIDYFTNLVKEGAVELVSCPHDECKLKAKGNPISSGKLNVALEDLEDLLSDDLVARFSDLHKRKVIQTGAIVLHCPRPLCQYPFIPDPNEPKLASCTECNFHFCILCKATWHGSANPCRLNEPVEIIERYLLGSAEEKKALELQYGRPLTEKLENGFVVSDEFIERYLGGPEENRLSDDYQYFRYSFAAGGRWKEEKKSRLLIQETSTSCPNCKSAITKISGCDCMFCVICHTIFCYRCGAISCECKMVSIIARC